MKRSVKAHSIGSEGRETMGVGNFARLLCVTDGKDSNSYFSDEGAELLSLFITWIARHEVPEHRNLTFLYRLVRYADAKQFYYMTHANDPLIMDDVERFAKMLKTAPQQWQGAISKAQLATVLSH